MTSAKHPWSVVIFACRESFASLLKTLHAARQAALHCAHIHVLVNGNPKLAADLADHLSTQARPHPPSPHEPTLSVWSIPLGDKANAWNQYIHHIGADESIAFFVDGYARLNPNAIQLLGTAVEANALALGGTGVPTTGRSARALRQNLIENTGYHGNFCCIKGNTMRQMRDQNIRLPVGLYRTDSLMGAILCYALDPAHHVWEDHRIHVHPEASWQTDIRHWWRLKDVQTHLKRYLRQARGRLEKAAFADHLVNLHSSPAALPGTAWELVLNWANRCPAEAQILARRSPLIMHALNALKSDPETAHDLQWHTLIWGGQAANLTCANLGEKVDPRAQA